MAYYLHTSALFKLVLRDEHTDALRAWAEANDGDLVGSDLLRVEAMRTARRHSAAALHEVRHHLDLLTIIQLTPDMFDRAIELNPQIPRSVDALHLAVALSLGDELEGIATYDDRLTDAAELHGIEVTSPGAGPAA